MPAKPSGVPLSDERSVHHPTQPEDGLAEGEAPLGPEREFTVEARSQWKTALRRVRSRHKLAMASLVVFILVTLLAFVGGRRLETTIGIAHLTPARRRRGSIPRNHLGHDFAQVLRVLQKSIEIARIVALRPSSAC